MGDPLRIRGFHLNFESYRRMGIREALRLVELAGQNKLNTLLVEYGPRRPFKAHPELQSHAALSVEEVSRLIAAAGDCGLEIIPLQQSTAHLEYVIGHERFAGLRERPERGNLLCPAHPESLTLIKELIREIRELHPQSKMIHLGGDEARKIGQCPRCCASGKSLADLYGAHMGALAKYALELGCRPIVWDDTFCALPRSLDHLPKETIINYWDYIAVADPTPVLIPRMAHANGGPRVAHDWRWMFSFGHATLSDVQRGVMKHYSHPSILGLTLGRDYLERFGPYLGDGFPRWIKALPYLEYYQDLGFDVITSPTGMGNGDMKDGRPNFARFTVNIAVHAKRCKENGRALGMITTAWYDMPPDMLEPSLLQTGEAAS
jgi:hypothetical protein